MLFAFSIFEQGLDVVIVQAGSIPHVSGFDLQQPAPGPVLNTERGAQQIIQRVPEGGPPGPAFALDPLQDIAVQGNRSSGPYAHDA